MTIYIFHGDNLTTSRQNLYQLTNKLTAQKTQLKHLDGKKITPAELEIALSTNNLFQTEALIIEYLFSRPKSQAQKQCLQYLVDHQDSKDIILFEKKTLTKTQLKLFPQAKIKLAKTPILLWKLIDSLTPSNHQQFIRLMHQTAQTTDEGFIFIMIARRVSELIIAKSGDTSKLSAWSRSKLIRQAQTWSETQLIQLHTQLTQHDHKLKTGKTKLTYLEALDIILTTSLC